MRVDPDNCRDPDLLAAEIRRLQRVVEAGWTLTDAEREAVTACVEICESQALSAHEGRSLDAFARWSQKAATLRGLLERTRTTND